MSAEAAPLGALRRRRLGRRRVPVILQQSAVECGAACLAMVLARHGRSVSVAECRNRTGAGRDGMTARALLAAARSYGMEADAWSLDDADFSELPLPAVAHWEFNHFVVVERWSPETVTIVDPARGRRRMTPEEFDEGFTGVVLSLVPGPDFEEAAASRPPAWRVYLRSARATPGSRALIAQVLGAALLLEVFGLSVAGLTKVLVDTVVPEQNRHFLPLAGVGIAVLVAAQLVAGYLRGALLVSLQSRVDWQVMPAFLGHLLALPYRYFQERSDGDLLMRLTSNTVLRNVLGIQTLASALDGTLALTYAVIILVVAPAFGLVTVCLGALQLAVVLGTARSVHSRVQQDLVAQAESEAYLVEVLGGIATLKASGAEARAEEHWSSLFANELDANLHRGQLSSVVAALLTTLRTSSPLVLLWMGTVYVLDGHLTLGAMLALTMVGSSFLSSLSTLATAGQQFQLVSGLLERIVDVLDTPPEQEPGAPGAPAVQGGVQLRDVSLRYQPGTPWAVRHVTLEAHPGQTVAIVGATGSGKSTLAKLLVGLYLPTHGDVLYDGVPMGAFDYRSLRRQFGVVMQESFLFSGSIRDNIALNDPGLPMAAVEQAARLAAVHDEVAAMPMGYETLVAEGGQSLSGGQRQRLALARAVAHGPALLVLDEATSNLDALTERRVYDNLRGLGCTVVVVAHRLSTVRDADHIVVLDGGRVAEQGTHRRLLQANGRYAELVGAQMSADGSGRGSELYSTRPRRKALITAWARLSAPSRR